MEKWVIPNFIEGRFKDTLWINFRAREFLDQSGIARGNSSISKGKDILGEWKLLAPKEIGESIAHDWGEYESIGTRIAQKMGDIKKAVNEIKGGYNALDTSYQDTKKKLENDKSVNARDLMSLAVGTAASTNVTKQKIDSSMVYQNSKRREYSLTFNFSITHINGNTKSDVFDPIRKLQELSCAQVTDGLIDIKFPAIFEIWTTPGDIIKINNGVITSVQPIYKAPYINGYPTTCDLQLTFMDISPLYRSSFGHGSPVRTSSDQPTVLGGK